MIARKLPDQKEMHRATLERDSSYDGLFFACVKTTRIFCRPSCPARKPLPRNIEFKSSVEECLLGGYRPCMRCKPLALGDDVPEWLERLLALVEAAPADRITDEQLRASSISPHAARRYFQRKFGITFQAYHRARRIGMAHQRIQKGETDLQVAHDHGYDSLSGFRDAFHKTVGATPSRSRELKSILSRTIDTPIGSMVACSTDDALCYLDFADRPLMPRHIELIKKKFGGIIVPGINEILEHLNTELGEYFDKQRTRFTIPLAFPGTPFQVSVWNQLAMIPFGETRSYNDLANAIGKPNANRAVGHANSENPIAIILPCHRVIRSDGSLSGYGGGLWRKHFLLDLERTVSGQAMDFGTGRQALRASAS